MKKSELAYAEKNDGIVNISSALWHEDSSFDDDHNIYMKDTPADGGYNHYELRYNYRQYTLPGVFVQGDENPSMGRAKDWVIIKFGN